MGEGASSGEGASGRAGRPGPAARRTGMTPLRIVLLYAAVGVTWLLLSDGVVEALVTDHALQHRVLSAKGFFFVGATAILLYVLVRRMWAQQRVLGQEVRAVLDGMADAVLVTDGEGDVVDVNQAALSLTGARSRHELLLPVGELLERIELRHPDGRRVALDETAAWRALRQGTVATYEALLRRLDGVELFVSVSSAPLPDRRRGEPPVAVTVIRDISEVKRFEETREEFLATAAHEFKTPLAVVKAYAQLMHRRGQGDPAALDVIGRQIDRLARMVQQLLEVSRFRIDKAELRRERFQLGELLDEVADAVREEFEGRHIVVASADEAPVLADRDRIGRVIASLLENAVRFSPQGGDVEAALSRDGAEAVVSVRDHGLGIAPERQARVFERFYRAHAGTPHDYGGLGIGLGMSREIVSRHGGRIWFESEPGRGSTFSFALPLAAEERA